MDPQINDFGSIPFGVPGVGLHSLQSLQSIQIICLTLISTVKLQSASIPGKCLLYLPLMPGAYDAIMGISITARGNFNTEPIEECGRAPNQSQGAVLRRQQQRK